MIDLPPQLILPDHYVAKRPAIIRAHLGDVDGLHALERERGIKAVLPGMVPVVAGGSPYLINVLQRLQLTTNLRLCLDAGDPASYSGSGQSWLDRSGNGYNFYLGSGSGSDAADPTFTGSVGSRSAYWSMSSDYFTYSASNATWMNNLHKNNATFSVATWVRIPNTGVNIGIFGFNASSSPNVGFLFASGGTDPYYQVGRGTSGSYAGGFQQAGAIPSDTWFLLGLSINEPTGAGFLSVNATTYSFSSTYSSPSASNATYTMQIGAVGNASISGGTKYMATFTAWEGVALSAANMQAIYAATRAWFGV